MKRAPLRRHAPLRAGRPLRRTTPLRPTPSMAASEEQRAAVAGRPCIVCGSEHRVDPAHVLPRSLGGCDAGACCIPLCRPHHRAYDAGELDLLPYLEPGWRGQLAHAVGHVGLVGALRRITAAGHPDLADMGESSARAGGVSFAAVSEHRATPNAKPVEDEEGVWARNERIRVAELRADSDRPMGELLEAGIELSRFASELAGTARPEP